MKLLGKYVQFSKIMVVIVVAAVSFLYGTAIINVLQAREYAYLASMLKGYTDFAGIVFVAYSGNSALEKWVTNKSLHVESESVG